MPALEGMRVLDMTQYEAGTACTQALAWLGADVVKIERPGTGDPGRGLLVGGDHSAYFLYWNANKRSVALDLGRPEGRALLLRMLPRYDVFVENFGPGVLEKLGLDYEAMRAVQPAIIHTRIKGFGSGGPYADYKCYDMVAQAASGAFSVTGTPDGPPMCPGPTMADSGTGVQAALAITAAYVQRLRTGVGQQIEVAMQEAMSFYMRTRVANGSEWGTLAVARSGNGAGPMLNLYPCKPGGPNDYVYLFTSNNNPEHWRRLLKVIGREDLLDDPRFASREKRGEHEVEIDAMIAEWTRRHDKHEAMRLVGAAGVPAGAVLDTGDLLGEPSFETRGIMQTMQHPRGPMKMPTFPVRFDGAPPRVTPAPLLGEHNTAVLGDWLGMSKDDVEKLKRDRIL